MGRKRISIFIKDIIFWVIMICFILLVPLVLSFFAPYLLK